MFNVMIKKHHLLILSIIAVFLLCINFAGILVCAFLF